MSNSDNEHAEKVWANRINVGVAGLTVLALILFARVGYLQVVRYKDFQTQAQGNRLQVIPTVSVRGKIVDRHGELIASQSPSFDLIYYPEEGQLARTALFQFLETHIGLTAREKKSIEQATQRLRRAGIVVRQNLSEEHIARISAHSVLDSGLQVRQTLSRFYPEGALMGHVSGYLGKISEEDRTKIRAEKKENEYWGIETIGKAGLERQYEALLRGTPGSREVEVDASGRIVRLLSENAPIPGQDLITTIDLALQRAAHNAFAGRRGALVALNPQNGEVLALVSEEGYDPNVFIEERQAEITALFHNPDRPMLNRAIAGVYPPASTFKPFVGLIGLNTNKRGLHDTIFDPGYYSLPGSTHRYRDWKAGGHGVVDFHKSLVQSVDTYYYGLAVSIGMETLSQKLAEFGFGQITGLDLPNERPALLPSPSWKKNRFKQDWFAGDTVSIGVGQGYMLATPLQMAHAYAILANRGAVYPPHLLRTIRHPITGEKEERPVIEQGRLAMPPEYMEAVINALAKVNEPGGTASRAFAGAGYASAGKTGTAQVFTVAQNKTYNAAEIRRELHDHAWYVGFAPVEAPTIVVAALLENAGGGGANAAPLVRQVFDAYFKTKPVGTSTPSLAR